MSKKRYQVFLSSTYRDLVEERDLLLRELAQFNYIAASMEYFPAVDEEQFEYIKRIIDDSDFYVIIVAGKYGSLAPDGLSYCEKEYDYALEKKLPVIPLLFRDPDSLPPEKQELNPDTRLKLEAFRKRLADRRLAAFWRNQTELCLALVKSLGATIERHPRPGWVRGSIESTEDLLRKIVSLEEENSALKERIKGPLIEHIKQALNETARLYFFVKKDNDSDAKPIEGSADVPWDQVAAYILPRIKWEATASRFTDVIVQFIATLSREEVVSVSKSSIDFIRNTFAMTGLINAYATLGGDEIVVVSKFGRDYVADAFAAYEHEARRNETFADGLVRHLNKGIAHLLGYKNWQG